MNRSAAYNDNGPLDSLDWMIGIGVSILIHVLVGVGFIFFSHSFSGTMIPLNAIDVDLSYLPPSKGLPDAGGEGPEEMTAPPPPTAESAETPPPEPAKDAQPEKTVEPEKPVIRDDAVSLKKEKDKPVKKDVRKKEPSDEDLIRKALKSVEKNVGKAPVKETNPLADRFKNLAREAERGPGGHRGNGGKEEGPPGGGAENAALINGYRQYTINRVHLSWAFSQNLTGGVRNLETWVRFEVLPDGEIINIEITRRSGNDYMDSAAVMAVKKSSPLKSWPQGITGTSMEMKLKFRPDGLK